MRFIHIADIHLGAEPDAGSAYSKSRPREIWNSLERICGICEEEGTDLLLIAGDLFHRQPLLRELKEVNACLGRMRKTQVALIIGNHDYLKPGSYYRSFSWAANIHPLLSEELECLELPKLSTAVYGMSYHSREITGRPYEGMGALGRQKHEILMLHGGDEKHMPIDGKELSSLGYDYVALGHIHKPQEVIPGKAAYSGALEPIDKNDTGPHGYIAGELTDRGCQIRFVPAAAREYRPLEIRVTREMTGYQVKELLRSRIGELGKEHMYKARLVGFRDPEVLFDLSGFDVYGNLVELTDGTRPAYDFGKLEETNRENILGAFIREFRGAGEETTEYMALCEGVQALMETRRD